MHDGTSEAEEGGFDEALKLRVDNLGHEGDTLR